MSYIIEYGDALQERQAILDLWEKGFGPGLEDRFLWMYEQNPRGVPDTWFLREKEGGVVGAVSLCRVQFSYRDTLVQVGQPMDFIIDQGHRSLGPALHMQKQLILDMHSKGYDVLYGFPNQKSRMVQKRAGFVEVGCFARWRLRLRSEEAIYRRVGNRLIAKAVSYAIDSGAGLRQSLFRRELPAGFSVSIAETMPENFDLRVRLDCDPSVMMRIRDRAYLQWRFFEHTAMQNKILLLEDGATIHGYIVYSVTAGRCTVLDFAAQSGSLLRILFMELVWKMRSESALSIAVSYLGQEQVTESLHTIGFNKEESAEHIVVALGNNMRDQPLLDVKSWHFTVGDRDV